MEKFTKPGALLKVVAGLVSSDQATCTVLTFRLLESNDIKSLHVFHDSSKIFIT